MSTPKVKDFIRWSFEDEYGTKCSYDGQVSKIVTMKREPHTVLISLRTRIGTVTFEEGDGDIRIIKPIKGWEEESVRPTPPKASKPTPIKKPEPKGRVLEVVNFLKDDVPKSRKEAIKRIVDSGMMSTAGASTYWNKAKHYLC